MSTDSAGYTSPISDGGMDPRNEPPAPSRWFQVMRTYSHTDHRCLWSVESMPFAERKLADDWRDFLQKEALGQHPKSRVRFYTVEVLT